MFVYVFTTKLENCFNMSVTKNRCCKNMLFEIAFHVLQIHLHLFYFVFHWRPLPGLNYWITGDQSILFSVNQLYYSRRIILYSIEICVNSLGFIQLSCTILKSFMQVLFGFVSYRLRQFSVTQRNKMRSTKSNKVALLLLEFNAKYAECQVNRNNSESLS